MRWVQAWWQQLFGHPKSDPWDTDPLIRSEREGQHERINHAQRIVLKDSWNDRNRQAWQSEHPGA